MYGGVIFESCALMGLTENLNPDQVSVDERLTCITYAVQNRAKHMAIGEEERHQPAWLPDQICVVCCTTDVKEGLHQETGVASRSAGQIVLHCKVKLRPDVKLKTGVSQDSQEFVSPTARCLSEPHQW